MQKKKWEDGKLYLLSVEPSTWSLFTKTWMGKEHRCVSVHQLQNAEGRFLPLDLWWSNEQKLGFLEWQMQLAFLKEFSKWRCGEMELKGKVRSYQRERSSSGQTKCLEINIRKHKHLKICKFFPNCWFSPKLQMCKPRFQETQQKPIARMLNVRK